MHIIAIGGLILAVLFCWAVLMSIFNNPVCEAIQNAPAYTPGLVKFVAEFISLCQWV